MKGKIDNRIKKEIFNSLFKKSVIILIPSLITLIESIIGIIQFWENTYDLNQSKYILLIFLYFVAFSLSIFFIIVCFSSNRREKEKKRNTLFLEDDKKGIASYLTNFINSGESVAILSHDMSWISDENKQMLINKSKKKELLLLLPHETPEVEELKKYGAVVRTFGNMLNDPAHVLVKSRMTVINWNKAFPKLTYPIKKDGLHYNFEFENGDPANQLAMDLINLLISYPDSKGEKMSKYLSEELKAEQISPNYFFNILPENIKKMVEKWYVTYINNEFEVENAYKIMELLNRYDQLDMRVGEEFIRVRDSICDLFNLNKDSFLMMYVDFVKISETPYI